MKRNVSEIYRIKGTTTTRRCGIECSVIHIGSILTYPARPRNFHWAKKWIYIGSKSIAKLKEIPHLHIFASVCQRAHIDFTPHLLPIAMVVNATFV